MKLAYARTAGAEPIESPAQHEPRPRLRVVPNTSRPPLPRRPSRRAVVRAQVWDVPVSTARGAADRMPERHTVDPRIAEAMRLLSGH